MNETTTELLRLLGYPIGSVLLLVILAYLGRQFFEKLLDSIANRDLEILKRHNSETLETLKNEYKLVLEDKKAELTRETERLKKVLSVETETYILAARKRFECLLSMWESSEALFKDTDFSNINSIKTSLERIDKALSDVNRYSVLLSPSMTTQIHSYLISIANVLTKSEKNFKENSFTPDVILNFIKVLPYGNFLSSLNAIIVPSIMKRLETHRQKSALEARQNLEKAIRIEFGVGISKNRILGGKEDSGSIFTTSQNIKRKGGKRVKS